MRFGSPPLPFFSRIEFEFFSRDLTLETFVFAAWHRSPLRSPPFFAKLGAISRMFSYWSSIRFCTRSFRERCARQKGGCAWRKNWDDELGRRGMNFYLKVKRDGRTSGNLGEPCKHSHRFSLSRRRVSLFLFPFSLKHRIICRIECAPRFYLRSCPVFRLERGNTNFAKILQTFEKNSWLR